MKLCGRDCVLNCANCSRWTGDFTAEVALCTEKHRATKDMAKCGAFECRNRVVLAVVKED